MLPHNKLKAPIIHESYKYLGMILKAAAKRCQEPAESEKNELFKLLSNPTVSKTKFTWI